MRLETARLIIREMVRADFDDLSSILQDEETMKAYEGAFSDEEVLAWLENNFDRYKKEGFGLMAVVEKKSNRMIGQCGLTFQNYNSVLVPEIGYLLNREYWHQGYAIEAARSIKEYAFNVLGLDEVFSIIRDTNEASKKLAIRNGMVKVGEAWKVFKGIHMLHYVYSVKRE